MFLKLLIIFFLRIIILKAKKRAQDLSKREQFFLFPFPFSPFHKSEILWRAMAPSVLIMCNGAPRVAKN